jgi:hypothetical protein
MRFLLPIVMWSACEAPPCLDAGCDEDADGVALPTDCDDGDPSVGAAATWHPDCDEDGVAADTSVVACAAPAPSEACEDGGVWRGTDEPHDDCDDTDPDAVAVTDWAADCDADGETGTGLTSCGAPDADAVLALCGVAADVAPGAVGGDCDDADPDAIATATWYVDCDVDGAASEVSVPSCGEPAPTCEGGVWTDDAPVAFDCDDRNAKTQYLRWRLDCDGDGAFGPAEVFCSPTEIICPDTGLSPPRLDPDDPSDVDCDDGDADALPGAVDHMGDGRDLDCDGDDAPRPAGERYYVSRTRGAAGNPGTRAAPFLTLDEALAVCVGGDVVRVAQGRYEVAEASRVRCSIYGGFSDDGAWTFDPARLTDIGIPANTSHSPLNLVSDGHPIELVALTVDVPSNWAMRMDNPPGVVTEFYGSHLTFGGGGWWDTVGTLVDSRLLRSVSVLGPDSDLTFERVVLGAVGSARLGARRHAGQRRAAHRRRQRGARRRHRVLRRRRGAGAPPHHDQRPHERRARAAERQPRAHRRQPPDRRRGSGGDGRGRRGGALGPHRDEPGHPGRVRRRAAAQRDPARRVVRAARRARRNREREPRAHGRRRRRDADRHPGRGRRRRHLDGRVRRRRQRHRGEQRVHGRDRRHRAAGAPGAPLHRAAHDHAAGGPARRRRLRAHERRAQRHAGPDHVDASVVVHVVRLHRGDGPRVRGAGLHGLGRHLAPRDRQPRPATPASTRPRTSTTPTRTSICTAARGRSAPGTSARPNSEGPNG